MDLHHSGDCFFTGGILSSCRYSGLLSLFITPVPLEGFDDFGPKNICNSNLMIPIIIKYSKTGHPFLHINFCGCVFSYFSRCFLGYCVFHSSLWFLHNFCATWTAVMSCPSRLYNMNSEDFL